MAFYDVAPLPGYPLEFGILLATLEDSSREWRGELERPDEDAIVWQARPGGHSIGGLLLHTALVERLWIEAWCLGRELSAEEAGVYMHMETNVDEGIWPTPPRKPLSWYYELLDDARVRTLAGVKEFPAPDAQYKAPWGATVTFRWTLAHVAEHDSYHGGQAVVMHDLYQALRG